MVMDDVIWVFQEVTGEHRDDGLLCLDMAGGHQAFDARHGGGRSRLASYSIAANHGFSVSDFPLAHAQDLAAGSPDRAQRSLPGDGRTDLDGGGQSLGVFDGHQRIVAKGSMGGAFQMQFGKQMRQRRSEE